MRTMYWEPEWYPEKIGPKKAVNQYDRPDIMGGSDKDMGPLRQRVQEKCVRSLKKTNMDTSENTASENIEGIGV